MRIYVRCKNCKGALAVIEYNQIEAGLAWLNGKTPKQPTLELEQHVCKTVWKAYPHDFEQRKEIGLND